MEIVRSVHNVPIRITDERWIHIIENHDDLAGYYDEILSAVESPELIINGYGGALIALRKQGSTNKYLAVIYKENNSQDGFIITAFFTSKINLDNEVIVWKLKQ